MSSSRSLSELHEVEPREQVGAPTGKRYEFQYHQAAVDCLHVLDDTQVVCVYCEWHDDYVIESAGITAYRFHQVKTRSASQGPWRLSEFFGIASGRPAKTDSVFSRLYDHLTRFGPRCELFVFVTDAGIEADFQSLLDATRLVDDLSKLPQGIADRLTKMHAALEGTFTALTASTLFEFIQKLYVKAAVGTLANLKDCRVIIGGRIHELSEVDLRVSEADRIGSELVAAVRERSHRKISLPISGAELRTKKGMMLDDVLKILSLSTAGYHALRSGGREAVLTLSRIHRLLVNSGMPATVIPELCHLKAEWDAWHVAQRHVLNHLDLAALKAACVIALQHHAAKAITFDGLRIDAKSLAHKYGSTLTPTDPLTEELVFGLMLALAGEAAA